MTHGRRIVRAVILVVIFGVGCLVGYVWTMVQYVRPMGEAWHQAVSRNVERTAYIKYRCGDYVAARKALTDYADLLTPAEGAAAKKPWIESVEIGLAYARAAAVAHRANVKDDEQAFLAKAREMFAQRGERMSDAQVQAIIAEEDVARCK